MRQYFIRPRIIFLCVALVLVATVVLFHKSILFNILEWQLKAQCKECFGGDLIAKSVYFKDDKWIYEIPHVEPSQDAGTRPFEAERLEIRYDLHFWKRYLDLDVTVIHPKINFGHVAPKMVRWMEAAANDSSLFQVNLKLAIHDGEIALGGDTPRHIRFQIEGNIGDHINASGRFHFGGEGNTLEISVCEDENQKLCSHVHAHSVDCAVLSQAFHLAKPNTTGWEVTHGVIDGNAKLTLAADEKLQAESYLKLLDLVIVNPYIEAKGKIVEASLRLNPPAEEKSHLLPIGSLDLLGDASLEVSRDGVPAWEFTGLRGALSIHTLKDATLAIDGHCRCSDGKDKNLYLNGDVHLASKDKAAVDMTLRILSLDHDDIIVHYIDKKYPEEAIHLTFKGGVEEISYLMPERLRHGFHKKFLKDRLEITTEVKRKTSGLHVEGMFDFVDAPKDKPEKISFGFSLEKKAGTPWKSHFFQSDKEDSIALRDGWLKAHDLPVEKYVSPFLFKEDQMSLSGRGDFTGVFDSKNLTLDYDVRNLNLENEGLTMELKNLGGLRATHVFDFVSGKHHGSIPLRNGTYFAKNSGLLFTDINGMANFAGETIHIPEIETYSNGVYFGGAIAIDYSSPLKGVFDIDIRAHTMHGRVSQLQHLFSHFNKPFFFLKFPMEGNISFRKEGSWMRFEFKEDGYDLHTTILGKLTDGSMKCNSNDVALHEFGMDFQYDHDANTLEFSDIQGTLLVGKPENVEEYAIAGDHVHFVDYQNNKAEFDVWVGDKKRDVIRLVGKTIPVPNQEEGEYVQFVLNRDLTHFGDVHPDSFQLIMKDWGEIDTFHLDLGFSLSTLFHDLQRFSRTGFFFLSKGLLNELNDLKMAEGTFKMELDYDKKSSVLKYNVVGDKVAVGPYVFNQFVLNGKKNHSWAIDQLQLDDLSFAADLERGTDSWKVNFLGLRIGKAFLMGMEGQYLDGTSELNAKVNLLEMDLAQLHEWSKLKDFVAENHPKGFLRATGQVRVALMRESPGWRLESTLNVSLSPWEFKGTAFPSADNLTCHFISNPFELRIVTPYQWQQKKFWLSAKMPALDFTKGEVTLSDAVPTEKEGAENHRMTVHWQNDPREGFQINKIAGHFSGIDAHLVKDPEAPHQSEAFHFLGNVHVNMSKAAALFPEEIGKKALDWKIGDGYLMKGKWTWDRTEDDTSPLHFVGDIEGNDCEFKGYRFRDLAAQVNLSPQFIEISQLHLADPAVDLKVPQITVTKNESAKWQFSIPQGTITDLRPSFLSEVGKSSPQVAKSLVIAKCDVEHVAGTLGEVGSVRGGGHLSFLNSKKRHLQNTIFAIPAEIVTRIGLDMAALNPVTGTIFFDISDGKVNLTRLKDVYSESKVSKFHLAAPHSASYVDFDGNLHIKVKMKHYNLVFKLAELFTVNIEGTLKKPIYSLYKQLRNEE